MHSCTVPCFAETLRVAFLLPRQRPLGRFIRTLGTNRVVLQSDGEPSILSMCRAVEARFRRALIVCTVRHSPRGSPQSNGAAEKLVGMISCIIRTLVMEVQENFDVKVLPTDVHFAWIVRHASCIWHR